ncbi:MAG: hypothetical protein DI587_17185 [Variovorax paradoxus]|nr:MAG: hypothetical protein DI583_17185 [Variovorax paradoxus]PZQ08969.1 MAG: hypothetical protein DI587_17185 [Variovorax paradoxus]
MENTEQPRSVASHRFDNAKRRRPDHHARQAMLTPPYVLEPVRELLGGIGLDPCTEPDNPTGAALHYHLPMDGAALPWEASTIWCNPPYGETRGRWVARCIEAAAAGSKVVLLIPSHTDTRIFQQAMAASTSVLFVKARLRFGVLRENGRQEAASHGSALLGYGVDLSPLASLGTVVRRAEPPAELAYWWSPKVGSALDPKLAGWSENTGPHPDWDVTVYAKVAPQPRRPPSDWHAEMEKIQRLGDKLRREGKM